MTIDEKAKNVKHELTYKGIIRHLYKYMYRNHLFLSCFI